MQEWLRDSTLLRDVLHRRLLRAAVSATASLARAARGHHFTSDDQRDASMLLVRLASSLVGPRFTTPDEPVRQLTHPTVSPEEDAYLADILQMPAPTCLEESIEQALHLFRKHGTTFTGYTDEAAARLDGQHAWEESNRIIA